MLAREEGKTQEQKVLEGETEGAKERGSRGRQREGRREGERVATRLGGVVLYI